ncbi:MAG: MetQ/NlpA family ABC transporter substrate-binding protein [Gammaproteobacteria bacterium]|nr:MetQ/NlpA family ABC transporter substrate-binding protein [Gammaproteobacteria bacterium]
MNNLKKIVLPLLVATTFYGLADEIKVGGMAGKEAEILYAAQKVAKEKFNLDVEVVTFNDYIMPNLALKNKEIDVNAFQHRPYLNQMVKQHGLEFTVVGDTFVFPIGVYSKKYKDIKKLPKGAAIAIPNDPSNKGRSLILLAKTGLIELADINNLTSSVLDITKNENEYNIKEFDAALLPRMLEQVDAAFINSGFAVDAGLLPSKDAILVEAKDSPYMNIIVAREEDKDKETIKKFVQAYQSDAVKAAAEKAFKGAAVAGW